MVYTKTNCGVLHQQQSPTWRLIKTQTVFTHDSIEHRNDSNHQPHPYKCNKQLVIALNPLPHSGSQTSGEAACDTCSRKLLNPNTNHYCSIACKVQRKRSA
ncbi:hypothetical protein HYC85_005197 [Camellia sinensis]|uniref:Uncharacterized protein n=1 Tax=Camellia sinensis TaxID=4442 RepID=A0A7J7HYT7_CAMSI|nr:hypothetical protein HYC85_005197 [Camellia sinensis]